MSKEKVIMYLKIKSVHPRIHNSKLFICETEDGIEQEVFMDGEYSFLITQNE
jgi:hypothetical protein